MKTKIVDVKEHNIEGVGILIQVVLMELMIIFAVITLISELFMPVFYAILVMILFTMAYNNIKVYKKKYMTPVYIIVGFFVLITTLMEYI